MTTSSGIRQPGTEATIVLRKYLDALAAGDLDTIADSFAEDATWSIHGTLPLSGTRHGRAAIIKFLISAGSLYQPGTQTFTFGQVTVEADRAVLEWRVRGTASATGREYDNAYCAEVREYLDSLHAAQALFCDAPSQGPVRTVPRRTDPEDEHGAAAVSGAAPDGCCT